jgi:hypothetical protein
MPIQWNNLDHIIHIYEIVRPTNIKKKKGIGWLSQWNEFIASVLNTFCQIDANDDGLVDLKKLNCP